MKTVFLLIIGLGLGYLLAGASNSSSEVTYNDHGIKTVVATCDHDRHCLISVGQKCEGTGYKVVSTDHDEMKTIITAECGKEKESPIISFGK
jgi:hypothetical protein